MTLAEARVIDKQPLPDAYVYLLGRIIAVGQDETDLEEPGVTYNDLRIFLNPNLDVALSDPE